METNFIQLEEKYNKVLKQHKKEIANLSEKLNKMKKNIKNKNKLEDEVVFLEKKANNQKKVILQLN